VRYTPALASSVFSMLRLFTLPCGWGDHDNRGPSAQPFHVLHSIQENLGLLCTPAVLGFAPGYVRRPGPNCAPILAQALNSLVWLDSYDDAYEHLFDLTVFPDSSATPA